jgi:hypothetical protein
VNGLTLGIENASFQRDMDARLHAALLHRFRALQVAGATLG